MSKMWTKKMEEGNKGLWYLVTKWRQQKRDAS